MELTEEEYDLTKMKALRSSQIEEAKKAKKWGIVLGTLGRQGNELILEWSTTCFSCRNCPTRSWGMRGGVRRSCRE